jgi:hypothetical protein
MTAVMAILRSRRTVKLISTMPEGFRSRYEGYPPGGQSVGAATQIWYSAPRIGAEPQSTLSLHGPQLFELAFPLRFSGEGFATLRDS